MKKQILALALCCISFAVMAQTTPEKKESKFEILVNAKLGFAKLKQTGAITLNGDINSSEALATYKLGKTWRIGTGIGFMEFNANPTIAGNTASLKNSYLQIPVRFVGDFNVFGKESDNQKIFFTIGLGLYANTLLKSELETISGNSDAKNLGWNFGFSSQIGAKFMLTDALNLGIGLEGQTDLSKMKKDGAEQKIENMNALYFSLGLKF